MFQENPQVVPRPPQTDEEWYAEWAAYVSQFAPPAGEGNFCFWNAEQTNEEEEEEEERRSQRDEEWHIFSSHFDEEL